MSYPGVSKAALFALPLLPALLLSSVAEAHPRGGVVPVPVPVPVVSVHAYGPPPVFVAGVPRRRPVMLPPRETVVVYQHQNDVIRAHDIRANVVRARVIYADEVDACSANVGRIERWDGRFDDDHRGRGRGNGRGRGRGHHNDNYGVHDLRTDRVDADTIVTRDLRAGHVVADVIYARDVDLRRCRR